MGDTTLTYEELSTLGLKIEACLNSHPLCPISSERNNLIALTPGHFLVGKPIMSPQNPVKRQIRKRPIISDGNWCEPCAKISGPDGEKKSSIKRSKATMG